MTEIYILNSKLDFEKNIKTILINKYNIIKPIIKHNKFGKPFINHSSLYISISYSKKINIFAISRCRIGIDIEEIKKTYPKIVCKIFTEDEKKYISMGKDKENYRFYSIWCCKEAIGKFLGVGLQYSTKSICTIEQEKIKECLKINNTYNKVYFNTYKFMNHIIILCSEENQLLNINYIH